MRIANMFLFIIYLSLQSCASVDLFAYSHENCQRLYDFGDYYEYVNHCSGYASNDVTTQWNLATIHRTQEVGLLNYQKAAYYTQLAASNRLPDAISQICSDYRNGTGGVRADGDRAIWWCAKAAKDGNDEARMYIVQQRLASY